MCQSQAVLLSVVLNVEEGAVTSGFNRKLPTNTISWSATVQKHSVATKSCLHRDAQLPLCAELDNVDSSLERAFKQYGIDDSRANNLSDKPWNICNRIWIYKVLPQRYAIKLIGPRIARNATPALFIVFQPTLGPPTKQN